MMTDLNGNRRPKGAAPCRHHDHTFANGAGAAAAD